MHGREDWSGAVYLGRENHSGQHILFDSKTETVAYARTVMRLPNVQKWNKDAMAAVRITPWNLHEAAKPDVIFREKVDARPEPEGQVQLARRVYIKPADIAQYGYISGCPKCEHEMKYGAGRSSAPHSEKCRQRIMEDLAKTDEGQARIARASARLDIAARELGEPLREDVEHQPAAQG